MVDSIALLWNVDFGYFFGFDTVLNESKIDDRVTEEVGLFVITFLDGRSYEENMDEVIELFAVFVIFVVPFVEEEGGGAY